MDLPKHPEFMRIGIKAVVGGNDEMPLTAVSRDGSDSNVMIAGGAAMAEECMAQLGIVSASHFLDTCDDDRIDRLVWDRYSIVRKPASPSFVLLTFTTTAPAPAAFPIPSGTPIASGTGAQYLTIENAVFPLAGTGPVTVRARSALAGAKTGVKAGALTSIVGGLGGAPADLSVTNLSAAAGGADRENIHDLRNRTRRFWRALRGGVKDAIEFGALSVPGCVKANAFEGLDATGRPNRIVSLVISDQFTDALVRQGVDVPSYESQSQAFAEVVRVGLEQWRAYGIHVDVTVAQVQLVPMTLRLRYRAGADTAMAAIMARAAAVDVCNLGKPGATFDPATLVRRLRSVPGLRVGGDEVEDPSGPVIPTSPYQVLRSTLSIVNVATQGSAASTSSNTLIQL